MEATIFLTYNANRENPFKRDDFGFTGSFIDGSLITRIIISELYFYHTILKLGILH